MHASNGYHVFLHGLATSRSSESRSLDCTLAPMEEARRGDYYWLTVGPFQRIGDDEPVDIREYCSDKFRLMSRGGTSGVRSGLNIAELLSAFGNSRRVPRQARDEG